MDPDPNLDPNLDSSNFVDPDHGALHLFNFKLYTVSIRKL